jgi:hypothetical protein
VVIAAREAEEQVAARLHAELSNAIRGVQAELALAESRLQFLQHQREQAALRIDRLAGLRATYTNVLGETASRAKLLERAEQSLTNARSASAGAKAASLIAAVDTPDTGTSPVSPGGAVIVLGGLLGGLLTGAGIVLLTAPAAAARGKSTGSLVASASAGGSSLPAGVFTTVVVPYRTREFSPQSPAVAASTSWSLTVEAEGSLNCTQALKVLNERGQLDGTHM